MKTLVFILILCMVSFAFHMIGHESGWNEANKMWSNVYCKQFCEYEKVGSCGFGNGPHKLCEEWLENE